jgi:hypothetical protein
VIALKIGRAGSIEASLYLQILPRYSIVPYVRERFMSWLVMMVGSFYAHHVGVNAR